MKTFNQFINECCDILERYYEPDEKLPSGRTPVQKAETRAETPYKNTRSAKGRQIRQQIQLMRKVRHGADNPNLNRHQQRGIDVYGDKDVLYVSHPESGVRYSVAKVGVAKNDKKPVYDIQWGHHHKPNEMDIAKKIQVARDAKQVWDTHVQHRLPHGAIVRNSPVSNSNEKNPNKNTRASLYRKAGFGEVGQENTKTASGTSITKGKQFAQVNREPSTKQKAKGKTRLSPLAPNVDYGYED